MTEQGENTVWAQEVALATLFLDDGVILRPSSELEVSTYCEACNEFDRTLVFGLTTRSHCRKCDGTIAGRIDRTNVTHLPGANVQPGQTTPEPVEVCYFFSRPISRNLVDDIDANGESDISWGRIRVTLGCPNCGERTEHSIQNNIERPIHLTCQSCDAHLGLDTKAQPLFSLVGVASP